MKKILLILTVLMITFSCGSKEKTDGANGNGIKASGNEKIKIEIISKGYQHEFWRTVELGAKKAGEDLGAEVNFIGPEKESEVGKQVGMVENAINKKVSAIGIAALDANALEPVIKKAIDAKIPVVSFDSDIKGEITASFVATDNIAAGELAGEEMVKRIGGKGKVAIVAHNAGTSTAIDREVGFKKAMAKYPDIQVLNTQFSDGDKSKALSITLDIINANPDIKGVFGTNEGAAYGVAKGIEEKGLAGRVIVIGFDSSEDMVKFIEKGIATGTVIQDPYRMGYETVKQLYSLIKGEKIEKRIDTGANFVSKENLNNENIQKLLFPLGKK